MVLNLQKSQYGPRYYLNVGFWFCELGHTRYPKDNMCHIVVRLEGLLPAADEQIQKLLDLGREMIDEQRMLELRTLLNKELLPLIERGSSIAGLRQMLADGMLEHAGIRGPAQLLLASTR